MSEQAYKKIEECIDQQLHFCFDSSPLGTPKYWYPISIERGDAVVHLRDADCGLAKDPIKRKLKFLMECAGDDFRYLYKRVGFYDFELASDPAVDEIAFAHQRPKNAGRTLNAVKGQLEECKSALRACIEALESSSDDRAATATDMALRALNQ